MYEVIIEYDNQGPVVVMRSANLGQCLDKQKRLIQDGHLDCFIARVTREELHGFAELSCCAV